MTYANAQLNHENWHKITNNHIIHECFGGHNPLRLSLSSWKHSGWIHSEWAAPSDGASFHAMLCSRKSSSTTKMFAISYFACNGFLVCSRAVHLGCIFAVHLCCFFLCCRRHCFISRCVFRDSLHESCVFKKNTLSNPFEIKPSLTAFHRL